MTTRVLPVEEWPRLVGTEAETVWPHLDATRTQILVVEEGDRIIGTWVLLQVLHAECLWIAPSHRRGVSVARRLWRAMRRLVRASGVPSVATAAVTDDVRALLAHVGAIKLDGDHYAMRMT